MGHEDWGQQIADSSNSIKNKHMNICEEDLSFDNIIYLQLAYGADGVNLQSMGGIAQTGDILTNIHLLVLLSRR